MADTTSTTSKTGKRTAGKQTAGKTSTGKSTAGKTSAEKSTAGKTASTSGRKKSTAGKTAVMKKITEPLVFGLDIGTRSIVGTVGYKASTNRFVVVAQVSVEHETRSMLDGQIHDIQAVAKTIVQVKKKLEDMLGRKLTDVCIAAAGRVLKTVIAKAEVEFNYETVITSEHIYSLDMLGVENAYEILRQEKHSDDIRFYCVGYSVIRYYQNGYPISNLEGHKANSIQTELIATFLPDEVVDGLYAAVEKAGLFVANLTLEPIAAINVAIPEKFRLLNIALVDVGAGTSDISITNDGSILAYGMIPAAGDEVTECLAKHYLTEFSQAEKLKCQSTMKKQVTYQDIMGLSHRVSSTEVRNVTDGTVRDITRQVADKIKELNGGKTVSAVFVVGGGGKAAGFVEDLAEYLELPVERVALRGSEVMGQIEFLQEDIKVDSLLVTPVGICLNYYEQRNNFIFVTVNGERVKLYDNSRLTVVDAALQVGFPNDDLFPKRGKTLNYSVNGEKRMRRGEAGEAAVVRLNGKECGLNDAISQNDKIEITESTRGADAALTVGEIPEYHSTMQITFNKKNICCPRFVRVRGDMVSKFYDIQEDDEIEISDYYTLEQVLEFMDIVYRGNVYVNNALAQMDTRVYDNFSIACEIKKEEPNYKELMEEYGEGQVPDAVISGEAQEADRLAEGGYTSLESGQSEDGDSDGLLPDESGDGGDEASDDFWQDDMGEADGEADYVSEDGSREGAESLPKEKAEETVDIAIQVNGEAVVLKNKPKYILVDVLDFYPFDLSVARGDHLETLVNGVSSEFTQPIEAGDEVSIFWAD